MSLTYQTVYKQMQIAYHRHGQPHRINGPAVIWKDSSLRWMQYGKYHRDNDKPAVVYRSGTTEFFFRGIEYDPKI